MKHLILRTLCLAALLTGCAWPQQDKPAQPHDTSQMPGTAMPSDTSKGSTPDAEDSTGAQSMTSTEHRHMDMGPHMKMTSLRNPKPGDAERAAKVADTARQWQRNMPTIAPP